MEIKEAIPAVRDILDPDSSNWGIVDVVHGDNVEGELREYASGSVFDHEYVDQHNGPGEDEVYGDAYFHIGGNMYLKAFYIV